MPELQPKRPSAVETVCGPTVGATTLGWLAWATRVAEEQDQRVRVIDPQGVETILKARDTSE